MYGNYPVRYRRIDRVSRRIRHNDGLKELLIKLKDKCKELLKGFMKMPFTKKIVYILGRVLSLAGVLFSVKDAKEAIEVTKALKSHNDQLMQNIREWYAQHYDRVSLMNISEEHMRRTGIPDDQAGIRGGVSLLEIPKAKYLMVAARIVGGLVAAIVGTVASEWAKG